MCCLSRWPGGPLAGRTADRHASSRDSIARLGSGPAFVVAAVDRQVARTWDDRIAGNNYRQQVNGQSQENEAARPRARMASHATPARYLGHVHAPDEQSAIDEAAKEFRVPDNLRNTCATTDERRPPRASAPR